MKAKCIGYKPYDFVTDEGVNLKGYTLFFATEGIIGVEGSGCEWHKVAFNTEKKEWPYGFNPNDLAVGAPYELEYGQKYDSKMNLVSVITKISRIK